MLLTFVSWTQTKYLLALVVVTFLILIVIMMAGLIDYDWSLLFNLAVRGLRQHSRKLVRNGARLDSRFFFFSVRVVKLWNELSEAIVMSPTTAEFKTRLHQDPTFSKFL